MSSIGKVLLQEKFLVQTAQIVPSVVFLNVTPLSVFQFLVPSSSFYIIFQLLLELVVFPNLNTLWYYVMQMMDETQNKGNVLEKISYLPLVRKGYLCLLSLVVFYLFSLYIPVQILSNIISKGRVKIFILLFLIHYVCINPGHFLFLFFFPLTDIKFYHP